MRRCPITYETIQDQEDYSQRGLRLLSPRLKTLAPLDLTADEQRKEAIARAGKMSIQGVQLKLSAQLKIKAGCFEVVDRFGHFILKPQSEYYPELPENEAVTMSLAASIGIEVPVHGLIYSKDGNMTYFIKRFDRTGKNKKLPVEDFSQLLGEERDTKYAGSMEKVIAVIAKFCTFPKIEFVKLFKLTLFNFLVGNEDMHLKNFSLITRNNIVCLSPAYDLLNSSIVLSKPAEEIALPLNGKKNHLKKIDFLEYYAAQRLGLNTRIITEVLREFQLNIPRWREMLKQSFLSPAMREKYLRLLMERVQRLEF